MIRYRNDELDRYEPPACDRCGQRVRINWIDVTCRADLPARYLTPGRWRCLTPDCPNNETVRLASPDQGEDRSPSTS